MNEFSTYYLPTQTTSLAHYFGAAIILPSGYYTNRPADIQNVSAGSLLISKERWVKDVNCSIEFVIDNNEFKLNRVDDNYFLLDGCLPVSRIKAIYFANDGQKTQTLWNVNKSTAFIPDHLVKVDAFPTKVVEEPNGQAVAGAQPMQSDYSERIKRYDVLLGGFSFMKLCAELSGNYPPSFFPTLAHFNFFISNLVQEVERSQQLDIRSPYLGLFSSKENEWTKWLPFIYTDMPNVDIENFARGLGIRIEKKLGIFQLDSLDSTSVLFDIVLLSLYGNNKAKSTEDLLHYLEDSKLRSQKIEEISLLFGLRNGYAKLRNRYKLRGNNCAVKVELTFVLDYYFIEGIYQSVFYGRRDNSVFDVLSGIFPDINNVSIQEEIREKIFSSLVISKKEESTISGNSSDGIAEQIIRLILDVEVPVSHPYWIITVDKEKALKYLREKAGSQIGTLIGTQTPFAERIDAVPAPDEYKSRNEVLMAENRELKRMLEEALKEKKPTNIPKKKKAVKASAKEPGTSPQAKRLDDMTFEELIAEARSLGIKVDPKAKKTTAAIKVLKASIIQKKLE